MDIGVIFAQMVSLYRIFFNASFVMFGMTFTIGQVITYGCFLTVFGFFISYLRK